MAFTRLLFHYRSKATGDAKRYISKFIKEVIMPYHSAKEIFNDSLQYIKASENPVSHNLSAGLCHLTAALEDDMSKIQRSLRQIADSLQQLERN